MANADTTTGPVVGRKVYIGDAWVVGILLRLAGHAAGNTVFTFKGGMEGSETDPVMTTLNMMVDNVTNTNAQNQTRIATKTLNTNGDVFLWLDPSVQLSHLEVDYNTTTDGAVTVIILKKIDE